MRGHGAAGERKGKEDAEAEDNLQLVTTAAIEQEISEDTVSSATWESRIGRQLRIDADTSE